jgi:hypothetical protein
VPSVSKPGRSRWFIQLRRDDVIKQLRKLGRVCRFGLADVLSPFPWVELSTEECSIRELHDSLRECELLEAVRQVRPVDPGKGATLARQVELFE